MSVHPADGVEHVVALRREHRLAAEAVGRGDDEEPGVDEALEEPGDHSRVSRGGRLR